MRSTNPTVLIDRVRQLSLETESCPDDTDHNGVTTVVSVEDRISTGGNQNIFGDWELILSFYHVGSAIFLVGTGYLTTTDGQAPSWFELSSDGVSFVPAQAEIQGNTVLVSAESIPEPKFVRMGWRDIAIPNLKDKDAWPVFAVAGAPGIVLALLMRFGVTEPPRGRFDGVHPNAAAIGGGGMS